MARRIATVIVPTFNRSASLDRLLKSLMGMKRVDSIALEVLVVDNGSTDETERIVREIQRSQAAFDLRFLREPNRGKSSALNAGLRESRGELILMVDDDVVVDPGWLAGHERAHRETRFDAIQGRVLPGLDPSGAAADAERLYEYNIPVVDYGEAVCEVRGLTGTNLSLKREVFESVGLFNPLLGPGASGFSEDTEYSMRIREAGFRIGYAPHAIVYHELDPSRFGRGYQRAVQYRKGLSRSLYRRDSIVFDVLPNLVASCARLALYRLFGSERKAYKAEGRVLRYWGYLAGRWGRRSS